MNLSAQVERYLPLQILELLEGTSKEAEQRGIGAYLVGGVVRDLLLGRPCFDLDLVFEGNAVEVAQQVARTRHVKLVTHPRFGTARLSYGDFALDLTSARGESYARPGALPAVMPASLKEDLIRRDFSINAMAISLAASSYGELIDLYHGKSDLEKGFIRILHSRSFRDDATRILRAIRYEQRLDFRLESETARLLKRDTPMLQTISADRIRHELELILREKCPERALARLGELEVLPEISPLLKGNGWIAEKFARARGEGKPGQLPALYFCLLDYPLSEKENEQLILRLKLPGKLAETMRHTLRLKSQLHLLERERMENSEIYYLLQEYTPLAVEANAIATESITASSHLHSFLGRLRYVRTSLNGEELKGLGIPAGPDLGRILLALHKARLDGEVKTREEEKRLALSLKR